MQSASPSLSFTDPWLLVRAMAAGAAEWTFAWGPTDVARISLADEPRGWRSTRALPDSAARMLDLYVPICRDPGRVATLGHLGQSIDGFIAGEDGESAGLNGPENILHLHRLRALFDVVMVGRQTATSDDPQLTTRLAEGPDPVRVVLDPNLECDPNLGLFGDDRATTLLLCATDAPLRSYPAQTAVRRLKCSSDSFSATEALSLLHAEGLTRVFIEGGGRTVSMALAEGVLDRLHIAVAPVFIGQGVRGVTVPGGPRFVDALRPPCTRFEMGRDVLFDFDLHPQRP